MTRESYKKLTEKDMLAIAKLSIIQGKSHSEIAEITGFPRRSVSHFLARKNKNTEDFWSTWDASEIEDSEIENPRIFIFDIETAPMMGFFWDLYNQNMSIDMIETDWFVMTWAGKWFGEEEVLHDSCFNHGFTAKKYFDIAINQDRQAQSELDREVIGSLWDILEQADMIVAHNGDKFDMRKVTARAIMQGRAPISPVKQIDTMKIAKRSGAFSSNKLDYLARVLCGESKVETGGFQLWKDCLHGCVESWKKMLDYNINDVSILENVWVTLAPYDKKCPSFVTHVESEITQCNSPACGSHNVSETGKTHKTNLSEFVGYVCNDCGHHMRGRKNIRSKEQMAATLMNVR